MKTYKILALGTVMALGGVASPASAAELIDNTVSCTQVGAGSSFTCAPASTTVGAGQEFVAGNLPSQPAIGFDFGSNILSISNILQADFSLGSTIINFENLSNPFTQYSFVSSTITGFDAGDVSLTGGVLSLNFIGTEWAARDSALLSIGTAAAVPEPTTWLLLLLGFGFVGGAMRANRRKQNVSVSYT